MIAEVALIGLQRGLLAHQYAHHGSHQGQAAGHDEGGQAEGRAGHHAVNVGDQAHDHGGEGGLLVHALDIEAQPDGGEEHGAEGTVHVSEAVCQQRELTDGTDNRDDAQGEDGDAQLLGGLGVLLLYGATTVCAADCTDRRCSFSVGMG